MHTRWERHVAVALLLFTGLLMLTLATVGALSSRALEEPEPERVEQLRRLTHAFETEEPGHGFRDLAALRKIVGDARIVSLGEATHGTREFFRMKHRITELLASEMGFTLFAIEANMPEAHRLNAWVLGEDKESDPRDLIAGMYFWTWNTEEVLDMVRWMREFNRAEDERGGPRRIGFTGFDMQTPDVAARNVLKATAALGADAQKEIAERLQKAQTFSPKQAGSGPTGFAVATGSFPPAAAAGKKVVFSGWIRTEGVEDGWAGLWWRADRAEQRAAAFDNMQDTGPRGTTDWQRFSVELEIPKDTVNINFGVIHSGSGTAWFDGLSVEIDGKVYDPADAFDFDFESGPPVAGFYTGGQGWQIDTDAQIAKTGARSLRTRRVKDLAAAGLTAQDAAKLAGEVLHRLEAQTDALVDALGDREAQWAIQNARIVLQCYQMFSGEVPRDRSMAQNVKWILDHAPAQTKIVLWAHNGHVQRTAGMMGAFLDEMYGDEQVVIGFTAAAGHYTAVVRGQGVRSENQLAAPVPGSVEQVLQATRQPRLIVDLHGGTGGETPSWLANPIGMRAIGAMAIDTPQQQFQPVLVAQAYDALIYFERTHASRRILRESEKSEKLGRGRARSPNASSGRLEGPSAR